MGIEQKILDVPRPKNTVVHDSKSSGPNRYSVRCRIGIKCISGRNPMPISGPIIGHIINGKYVPIAPKAGNNGPSMLSYGSSRLVKDVSNDILDDLLKVYSISDSYSIIAAASLKVIKPSISSRRMMSRYEQTFLSVYYPGASLSKNSLTRLYIRVGQDEDKMRAFYKLRLQKVLESHHVIIDGTLKQDTSKVNDLSRFSYKSRVKGLEDISILYAFDFEIMEPVCSAVFPGNSIDAVSYHDFVFKCGITKGIIVDDKGFPAYKIKDILRNNPGLHYLTPIQRSDNRIGKYNMLDFEGVVHNIQGNVLCKKVKVGDNQFLYSFQDSWKEYKEKRSYIQQASKKNNFSQKQYNSKQECFGVIVFESDVDLTPEQAYACYQGRWKLEVVFKRYKSDISLYTTKVQTDFAVIGSEFVNFISTLITCRIVNKASEAKLFEEMTYEELMDDLSEAWRKVGEKDIKSEDLDVIPKSSDNNWVHTIGKVKTTLEVLGLAIPEPNITVPKKRGRPAKKDKEDKKQKRPVGRPRKNSVSEQSSQQSVQTTTKKRGRPKVNKTDDNTDKPVKHVGRPRKNSVSEQSSQQFVQTTTKKRGRPKVNKADNDTDKPVKHVGRPRKNSVSEQSSQQPVQTTTKKRGRPKVNKTDNDTDKPIKHVGRPRKNSVSEQSSQQPVQTATKKRGRPRKNTLEKANNT